MGFVGKGKLSNEVIQSVMLKCEIINKTKDTRMSVFFISKGKNNVK